MGSEHRASIFQHNRNNSNATVALKLVLLRHLRTAADTRGLQRSLLYVDRHCPPVPPAPEVRHTPAARCAAPADPQTALQRGEGGSKGAGPAAAGECQALLSGSSGGAYTGMAARCDPRAPANMGRESSVNLQGASLTGRAANKRKKMHTDELQWKQPSVSGASSCGHGRQPPRTIGTSHNRRSNLRSNDFPNDFPNEFQNAP